LHNASTRGGIGRTRVRVNNVVTFDMPGDFTPIAVVAAFTDPAVRDTMTRQGDTIAISTPEQARTAFRSEPAKHAALVKKAGIEPR
jgi:hypothetical protein